MFFIKCGERYTFIFLLKLKQKRKNKWFFNKNKKKDYNSIDVITDWEMLQLKSGLTECFKGE